MVTTRRREQLQQQQQAGVEDNEPPLSPRTQQASPTTPPGPAALDEQLPSPSSQKQQQQQQEQPNAEPQQQPTPPPQLKSALKAPRRVLEPEVQGDGAGGSGEEATPAGQGIKKRVRIHSSNNIVHVFGASSADGRHALAGEEAGDGGEATPQSRWRRYGRAPVTLGTPSLLHYQAFIRGVMLPDRGGGTLASQEGQAARLQQQRSGVRPPAAAGAQTPLLPAAALLSILGWMLVSSVLIFVNKTIMVDRGFRFPFALTALGQAASMLLGWLAGRAGLAPLRPPPSISTALTKLFPVAFCSAATLFLGNYAYLGLSVAFINILKALTPAVTLGTCALLGLERPSLRVAVSIAFIGLGTAIATAQESASSHFSWLAFGSFMLSIVFEALRCVLAERLLGGGGGAGASKDALQYNVIEALVYIGPLIFLLLAAGAVATEAGPLLEEGFGVVLQHPRLFVAGGAVGFLVNAFSFFAIQTSSSLTFKVAGCLKNVVVVGVGVALGDELTAKEAMGYALSMVGFLGYTLLRSSAAKPKQA